MDYSFYLRNGVPDCEKLKEYGFKQRENAYVLNKDLSDEELCCIVTITDKNIDVRVVDKEFEEDYIPFGIKDNPCLAKAEVENILEDVTEKCFVSVDMVKFVMDYVHKKYVAIQEEPWDYLPEYYTFKTPNSRKWFGIIMHVKANKIGLEGEKLVDIMNVKIDPSQVDCLVDGKHYFYAYHMNKKNWITILLDGNLDKEMLKKLVDNSFNLVEKMK